MSHGLVVRSNLWNNIVWYNCLPPLCLECLEEYKVEYLREMYKVLCDDLEEENVVGNFEKFSAGQVGGELYGSFTSRSNQSAYVLASWVSNGQVV